MNKSYISSTAPLKQPKSQPLNVGVGVGGYEGWNNMRKMMETIA